MKKLFLGLALFVLFIDKAAPGEIHTSVISGSAAFVQITTTSLSVHWVQLIAPSGNMSTAYWGDGAATTSTGSILPAGAGQMLPPTQPGGYDLSQVFVYAAMGDTLRISWDVF